MNQVPLKAGPSEFDITTDGNVQASESSDPIHKVLLCALLFWRLVLHNHGTARTSVNKVNKLNKDRDHSWTTSFNENGDRGYCMTTKVATNCSEEGESAFSLSTNDLSNGISMYTECQLWQ